MREIVDTYRHKGLRKILVNEIAEMGIDDARVLDALNKIPRHLFMDGAFLEFAYENKAFQIGAGQTISQPYTVAFQTQLLDIQKGDNILEIGTGSGYQTCILCELGAKVVSIERHKLLCDSSSRIIQELGYRPRLHFGDGFKGKKAFAPFDKVIVTCGAPFVPDELVKQTRVGGRLVIPLGAGNNQKMVVIDKVSEDEIVTKDVGNFSFVPMLKNRVSKT